MQGILGHVFDMLKKISLGECFKPCLGFWWTNSGCGVALCCVLCVARCKLCAVWLLGSGRKRCGTPTFRGFHGFPLNHKLGCNPQLIPGTFAPSRKPAGGNLWTLTSQKHTHRKKKMGEKQIWWTKHTHTHTWWKNKHRQTTLIP